MLCLFNIILTITSFSKQTSEPFTLSTNIFHPSYITVLVLYSSAIFSCKISCKVGMDTSRAVCAYSLRTIFCKHATFFIAGKVWRCSVHVSRFIQSTGYSWRSNIWSKEKLHKENGQKICCYCGFESTDELGARRRYVVFINALANGLVVIIFFFLYTQNPGLKLCLLAVSFTFSRFMKKYNPCQVGTPRAVPIFQKKVVLLLSQYECFCFWHANWQKPTFRGQKIPLLSQLMWLSLVDIVWITKLRIICVHVGSREYPYTHHV